jgi:hypothetical protein
MLRSIDDQSHPIGLIITQKATTTHSDTITLDNIAMADFNQITDIH